MVQPDKVEGNQSWGLEAARLQTTRFEDILISNLRSVPEVLAGFILQKVGVVRSLDDLKYPLVWNTRVISPALKQTGLLLFNDNIQNPSLLTHLIKEAQLDVYTRARLLELAKMAMHYRRFENSRWQDARDHIQKFGDPSQLNLHDFISIAMDANSADPARAFIEGVNALERFFDRTNMRISNITPVNVDVPVIKEQRPDEDEIDQAVFSFDRIRILYLTNARFKIVVGGSPNSGKSTFASSLVLAMRKIIEQCVKDGIIEDGSVKVGFNDLDRASRTGDYVLKGLTPPNDTRKQWDWQMGDKARALFEEAGRAHNVTIGDLPGGQPDNLTQFLASGADFSIIVNKVEGSEMKDWQQFFTSLSRQANLVRVNTLQFFDRGHPSGLRSYNSIHRGSKENLLWGRVVGLDRKLYPDDEFISLTAHALLFDYLPSEVTDDMERRGGLHGSLRGRLYQPKIKKVKEKVKSDESTASNTAT